MVIDKPEGLTSHDVCARVKRALGCLRVGHTGTLDPIATGVLPLLLDGATKWANRFATDEKEYLVTAAFGVATTTYDREGTVAGRYPVPSDLLDRVMAALPQFTGTLAQIPPPFSAVKHRGKPLYWWARQGIQVAVPPRSVEIRSIALVPTADGAPDDPASLDLHICCSKGTYIRSLVHDLGSAIGCGAMVLRLRRLRSGTFGLDVAHQLETVCADRIGGADKFLYKKNGDVIA